MDEDGLATTLDNLPSACYNLVGFVKIMTITYYISYFEYYESLCMNNQKHLLNHLESWKLKAC